MNYFDLLVPEVITNSIFVKFHDILPKFFVPINYSFLTLRLPIPLLDHE